MPVTGRHILIPGLFFAPGLQYYIMTLQRTRPIIEEAGFEPGTSLPLVVQCAPNDPPHTGILYNALYSYRPLPVSSIHATWCAEVCTLAKLHDIHPAGLGGGWRGERVELFYNYTPWCPSHSCEFHGFEFDPLAERNLRVVGS